MGILRSAKGEGSDRSQAESWMFTNQAFEEAVQKGEAGSPLTHREMKTMMTDEQMRVEIQKHKAAEASRKPKAFANLTRKLTIPSSGLGKQVVLQAGGEAEDGWNFTNPLSLFEHMDTKENGDGKEAAEGAAGGSSAGRIMLGSPSAKKLMRDWSIANASALMLDSDDDEEEFGGRGQPVITPRDYVPTTNNNYYSPTKKSKLQESRGPLEESSAENSPMAKHLPSSGKSATPLTPGPVMKLKSGFNLKSGSPFSSLMREQSDQICHTPTYSKTSAPAGEWTKCTVERIRKKGNGKSSKFVMRDCDGEIILAAKRNKADRVIRFYRPNWDTSYSECVGLAQYDKIGAQFVLRGADIFENVTTDALMALLFGLTTEGPREMFSVIPANLEVVTDATAPEDLATLGGPKEIERIFKAVNRHGDTANQHVEVFRSAMPVWDPKMRTYRMDFEGRVKKPSVKNMKLQAVGGAAAKFETINPLRACSATAFICGRIDNDTFACDFKAPYTPLQAFCMAAADLIHKPIYHWI